MLYNDFSILDNLGRLFSQKKKTPRIDYFFLSKNNKDALGRCSDLKVSAPEYFTD
jgi:hypothetical protein